MTFRRWRRWPGRCPRAARRAEQRRVVHERGGEPHPLAHPARVAPEPPVLRLDQIDRLDRPGDGAFDVGHGLQACSELDELASREEVVHRLVLGHEADPSIERRVPAYWLAEGAHRSLGRCDQAGDGAEQGGLAGAVRAEQRGDARLDHERDVADRDHPRKPARQAFDDDRRLASVAAHSRINRASAGAARPSAVVSPASQRAETHPGSGRRQGRSRRSSAPCRASPGGGPRATARLRSAPEKLSCAMPPMAEPTNRTASVGDRGVRPTRRERRREQRQRRQQGGERDAGDQEPRHDVPVVGEPRARARRVERVPVKRIASGSQTTKGDTVKKAAQRAAT